jgi:hypothetical protein
MLPAAAGMGPSALRPRSHRRAERRDDAHGYAQFTQFIPEEIGTHLDTNAPRAYGSDDPDEDGRRPRHVDVFPATEGFADGRVRLQGLLLKAASQFCLRRVS